MSVADIAVLVAERAAKAARSAVRGAFTYVGAAIDCSIPMASADRVQAAAQTSPAADVPPPAAGQPNVPAGVSSRAPASAEPPAGIPDTADVVGALRLVGDLITDIVDHLEADTGHRAAQVAAHSRAQVETGHDMGLTQACEFFPQHRKGPTNA